MIERASQITTETVGGRMQICAMHLGQYAAAYLSVGVKMSPQGFCVEAGLASTVFTLVSFVACKNKGL